ncbi:MAG: hypothetical protein ACI9BC_002357, partial [Crocinitomicaceae bacterium]
VVVGVLRVAAVIIVVLNIAMVPARGILDDQDTSLL